MNSLLSDPSSIQCRNLSVCFSDGTVALKNACLDVNAGESVAIVGPSGCGKTTLLRAIAGLQVFQSGTLRFTPDLDPGKLSFVFQQPALLPWRSALENVSLPLELSGEKTNRAHRRQRAVVGLHSVGLSDADQKKRPFELSGGMQMRVSIARALINDPSILLLDEPFAAVDDMLRNRLGQLVLGLWRQRPRTMLLVTHNIGEALMLSHRVVVLRQGSTVGEVTVDLPADRTDEVRRSPEFGRLYGQISDLLRNEGIS